MQKQCNHRWTQISGNLNLAGMAKGLVEDGIDVRAADVEMGVRVREQRGKGAAGQAQSYQRRWPCRLSL
jgi:hypothetical protein